MNRIPDILLRQTLLLLLIGLLGVMLLWKLFWIMPAALIAYTLYILLRRPMENLVSRRRLPPWLAAVFLMLIAFGAVGGALYSVFYILNDKLGFFQGNPERWFNTLEIQIKALESRLHLNLISDGGQLADWAAARVRNLFVATVDGVAVFIIGCFFLFYMLTQSRRIEEAFRNLLPLEEEDANYLRKQLDDQVFANALGIPLMGIVQGLAGILIYSLLDIPNAGLWFLATCITGMLPFLGVALVYVPLTIILLAQDQFWDAMIILAYGFIVIGSIDNVARMWLLERIGKIHPLITLVGVLFGIPLFGFIGFIFGPILLSVWMLLIQLYAKEFHSKTFPHQK